MQFRIGNLADEIIEGGELLRPFGPRQIALKFSHIVGTFDAPLSQKGLEFWARNAGEFGRFAERQQAACVQSQRHLLRHLRLRRRRRQVDILQKAVGNIKCQRHPKIITASAEERKPSTGPRSIERGMYRSSSSLTCNEPASTGPRLRNNDYSILEPDFLCFTHASQKFSHQGFGKIDASVTYFAEQWSRLWNHTVLFAPGEDGQSSDDGESQLVAGLSRCLVVQQNRHISTESQNDGFGLTNTETLVKAGKKEVLRGRNNFHPRCFFADRVPNSGCRIPRIAIRQNLLLHTLRNYYGRENSMEQIEPINGGQRNQRRCVGNY